MLDYKRKFIDASQKYHELSFAPLDQDEKSHALSCSIKCAIRARAGPQRSRILQSLMKDDRVGLVCPPELQSLLESVCCERMLDRQRVESFRESLQPHQNATLEDGHTTVLDRAVLEHNVMAISRLYMNISAEELGSLIGVSAEQAIKIAGQMISENRLQASVDECAGWLSLTQPEPISVWNQQIRGFFHRLLAVGK